MKNKSIALNYVYNLIYQILIIIIPIILIPYISRHLLSEAIGEYSFSFSIVSYFVTISLLGIVYYGNRQISLIKNDSIKLNDVFWGIFLFKLIISIISFILYILFVSFFIDESMKPLYYVQSILILSVMLDISWFFTGMEDFKNILIRNVFVKLLSLSMIFILVKKPEDLILYALILSLSEIIGQALMWISLPKYKIKINFKNIKQYKVIEHGKGLFILFLPRAAIQIYTTLNVTMLGVYNTKQEVAYFDYANKIVSLLLAIVTSVGIVMLPRISMMTKKSDKDDISKLLSKSLRTMLYIGIPIMFGLMSISNVFVPLFLGDEFSYVAVLLLVLPIKMIFVIISNVTGIQFLIAHNRNKEFFVSSILGGVISIIINILIVKNLGSLGSVLSLIIAEMIVTFSQIYFVRKDISIIRVLLSSWKIFVSGLVMFTTVFYISKNFYTNIIDFISNRTSINGNLLEIIIIMILILIGVSIYSLLVIILREETNEIILNKLKKLFSRREINRDDNE